MRRVSIGLALLLVLALSPGPATAVCGTKRYCREMGSCAEAYYFMTVCGRLRLDGDNDGIPCEKVCGKSLTRMRARIAAQPFKAVTPQAPGLAMAGTGGVAAPPPTQFRCSAKRTRREMDSCAEATFYLTRCGLQRLDGNRDGIACNSLCRR